MYPLIWVWESMCFSMEKVMNYSNFVESETGEESASAVMTVVVVVVIVFAVN